VFRAIALFPFAEIFQRLGFEVQKAAGIRNRRLKDQPLVDEPASFNIDRLLAKNDVRPDRIRRLTFRSRSAVTLQCSDRVALAVSCGQAPRLGH
jgi:hypothetical protein